jgi:membrane associated rhomboid family serine protease
MKIRQNLQTALTIVAIPWLMYFINFFLPIDLRLYGLRPRRLDSLAGIVFTPFLHVDLRHIMANSGILFVLPDRIAVI